jgi:hypothetical protein
MMPAGNLALVTGDAQGPGRRPPDAPRAAACLRLLQALRTLPNRTQVLPSQRCSCIERIG